MQQLGYGLSTVTGLWVASQLANAFTLFLWGNVPDRLSNKAVLRVACQPISLVPLALFSVARSRARRSMLSFLAFTCCSAQPEEA
jgi:EamA domain-containing membrane protein RarD